MYYSFLGFSVSLKESSNSYFFAPLYTWRHSAKFHQINIFFWMCCHRRLCFDMCVRTSAERRWRNDNQSVVSFETKTDDIIVNKTSMFDLYLAWFFQHTSKLSNLTILLAKWTLWTGRWPQHWAMRLPLTGSSREVLSVHEHGWSEPAKTTPGEEEKPVDGHKTHDPPNKPLMLVLP